MEQFAHGFGVRTGLSLEEAEAATRRAPAEEGFGVPTEIDVAATMRAKLGVERPACKILGVGNPPLAHRALSCDEQIGLLLPGNVVVYDAGGTTVVAARDPALMSRLSAAPGLEDSGPGRGGRRSRRAFAPSPGPAGSGRLR